MRVCSLVCSCAVWCGVRVCVCVRCDVVRELDVCVSVLCSVCLLLCFKDGAYVRVGWDVYNVVCACRSTIHSGTLEAGSNAARMVRGPAVINGTIRGCVGAGVAVEGVGAVC